MAIENHQLVDIIRKRQGENSLRTFATSLDLSAAYLSEVMRGMRPVGPKLAKAFGYVMVKTTVIRFKKKGTV